MELIAIENIKIEENFNSRKNFDQDGLNQLANSIKEHGIIQPIVVRMSKDKKHFTIVAGERRFKAAQIAKLEEIPVVIKQLDDSQALQLMTIENLQRKNLHPLEEAEGIDRLFKMGLSAKDIAAKLGVSKQFVSQRNTLNLLIPALYQAFQRNLITIGSAVTLARLNSHIQEKINELMKKRNMDLSAEDAEKVSHRSIENVIQQLETSLSEAEFDTSDADLIKNAPACNQCNKTSCAIKDLFADQEEEDDIVCLDHECFALKTQAHRHALHTEAIEKTGRSDIFQLSSQWYLSDSLQSEELRTKNEYCVVSDDEAVPDTVEVKTGVIVDGENAGQVVDFFTRQSYDNNGPMTDEQKAERKKIIRSNKIKNFSKRLACASISDAFHHQFLEEGIFNKSIMNELISRIIGFGQSKEFIDYFSERYNWQIAVDYDDFANRREVIEANIEAMPNDLRLKLLVDASLLFTTVSDYDDTMIHLMKTSDLIEEKQITKQAIYAIDHKIKSYADPQNIPTD